MLARMVDDVVARTSAAVRRAVEGVIGEIVEPSTARTPTRTQGTSSRRKWCTQTASAKISPADRMPATELRSRAPARSGSFGNNACGSRSRATIISTTPRMKPGIAGRRGWQVHRAGIYTMDSSLSGRRATGRRRTSRTSVRGRHHRAVLDRRYATRRLEPAGGEGFAPWILSSRTLPSRPRTGRLAVRRDRSPPRRRSRTDGPQPHGTPPPRRRSRRRRAPAPGDEHSTSTPAIDRRGPTS